MNPAGPPALLRLGGRLYRRHWGRMLFFSVCIGAGTAFLFSIGNLLAAVNRAIALKSRELLAADVEVGSSRPFDEKAKAAFARLQSEGARTTDVLYFSSMLQPVRPGAEPFLVGVKAVEDAYPFYGRLETSPPEARGVLLEKSGALEHGLKAGDAVSLGRSTFRISGLIEKEPDRAFAGFSMGPRLLMPLSSARSTHLAEFGSRVWHERLIALPSSPRPDEAAKLMKDRLEKELADPYLSISAFSEADANLREALQRTTIFFVLVALVALLLGATGMAAGVTIFLNEQVETVGLLRSLGLGPASIARLYHGLCLAVGVQGGLIGAAAGWGLSAAGLRVLVRLLKVQIDVPFVLDRKALAEGLALAGFLSVGVTFGKVRALARLSPLDILRERANRLPPTPWGTAATLAIGMAGIFAYTWLKLNSLDIARYFSLSLGGAGLVIALLIVAALGALNRAAGVLGRLLPVRHGLLQLARQKARTLVSLFTLSAGFTLIGALGLVHRSLSKEILLGRAEDVPDLFLVDIQKNQVPAVAELTARHAKGGGEFAPLIRARLTHVNGVPVLRKDLSGMTLEERSRYRFLTREYNLTYKDALNASEKVTSGRFWSPGESGPQISLEEGFSQRTRLRLGDILRFDVQGRPIEAPVTSLRSIEWMSMKPNFFVVMPPAVLERAPQAFIASLKIRDAAAIAGFQKDLVKEFPNVSVINVTRILNNVQTILGAVVSALRLISWFCVAVGLLVLAGTLSLGHKERREQAALFRALGAERRTLIWIDAVEFASLGLLTFLISLVVSYGLGWAVSRKMDVTFASDPGVLLLTLAGALLLPAAVGLAVNARAYGAGVLETFRREA